MSKALLIGLALALAPAGALAEKSFVGDAGDWDCGKDPSVSITRGKGTFKFTGVCSAINIQGGGNKLVVESVAALNVSGDGNTLEIGTVGSINVVGAGNKITWKKSKSGDKPKIDVLGSNSIEKAK